MTEDPRHRAERHARVRLVKRLLRFAPRRAVMHRYPVVGRFAAAMRRMHHLWSFRTEHVRPAIYGGSLLAYMPLVGVQLPLALLLCFVLRANFMVAGGLQFITNVATAVVIYPAAYEVGMKVIEISGFGRGLPHDVPPPPPVSSADHSHDAPPPEPGTGLHGSDSPAPERPAHPEAGRVMRWLSRLGTGLNALIIGGTIFGLLTGVVLDVIWRFGVARAAAYRLRHPRKPRPHLPPEPL